MDPLNLKDLMQYADELGIYGILLVIVIRGLILPYLSNRKNGGDPRKQTVEVLKELKTCAELEAKWRERLTVQLESMDLPERAREVHDTARTVQRLESRRCPRGD